MRKIIFGKKESEKGFSLIELIIVTGIIAVFSSLSLGYYNNFTEERKLDRDAKKLVDIIELTKKKAQAGDIESYSCGEFSGYTMVFLPASYTMRLCCDSTCTSSYEVQTFRYQTNIAALITGSTTVHFEPLTLRTDLSTDTTIRIQHSGLDKCVPIVISPLGVVEEMPKESC